MAKIASTILKVLAGAVAGGGIYRLGQASGAMRAQTPEASERVVPMRPGLKMDKSSATAVSGNAELYHASINACACDLRARIADQVYDGAPEWVGVLQVDAQECPARVELGSFSGKENDGVNGDDVVPDALDAADETELEPYQIIQNALNTTSLFDEQGDQKYEPTPFVMPR